MELAPFELRLDRFPSAAKAARDAVSEWLRRVPCDEDKIDSTVLLVSELVTNAVIHAGSAPLITAAFDDGWLRLEVHDDSPEPHRWSVRPGSRAASVSASCHDLLTGGDGHSPTPASKCGSRFSAEIQSGSPNSRSRPVTSSTRVTEGEGRAMSSLRLRLE